MAKEEDSSPKKVTDISAAESNITMAVQMFVDRWMPWPRFDLDVEIMDVGQLRDAMGLRASIDVGDPWPSAEKQLLDLGFRWQSLSGMRVMYLKERDEYKPDTGWEEAEEYIENGELEKNGNTL